MGHHVEWPSWATCPSHMCGALAHALSLDPSLLHKSMQDMHVSGVLPRWAANFDGAQVFIQRLANSWPTAGQCLGLCRSLELVDSVPSRAALLSRHSNTMCTQPLCTRRNQHEISLSKRLKRSSKDESSPAPCSFARSHHNIQLFSSLSSQPF
jgi:hypothetical protein